MISSELFILLSFEKRFLMQKKIMGIVNVTPDSYFDSGKYLEPKKAIDHALKLLDEGADILDIGGCSTRPFSHPPTIKEEIKRISPVVKELKKRTNIPLSIDTYRYEVAKAALDCGATFLNDIEGFRDPKMLELAKEYKASICIMHMQGNSQTMQINPLYPKGIIQEICDWLNKHCQSALALGIQKKHIYLDPGIGFGKNLDDNFKILHNLSKFRELNFPLLVGLSRKSFLYKTLNTNPEKVLPATIAMNAYIYPNVDIFRVHDVLEHKQMLKVIEKVSKKPSHINL